MSRSVGVEHICRDMIDRLGIRKFLKENSALCELFGIDPDSVTKDMLYRSSRDLYGIHRLMEDYLHGHVCTMFDIDEKILLFDITNMYAEGAYSSSGLFQYGRSKEKRDDLKIVVLAAVVNRDGLLVRTNIYDGNRQDITTLEEVVGSLEKGLNSGKRVIVIDAGFFSGRREQHLGILQCHKNRGGDIPYLKIRLGHTSHLP